MSFATRIFLALLGVSLVTGLARSTILYNSVQEHLRKEYAADYRQRVRLLGDSFRGMEQATDDVAANAARVVAERITRAKTLPSNDELARLAREMKIDHIEIADSTGKFVRGTRTDQAGIPERNLFGYCPEYRDLFSGKIQSERTPIVPDEKGTIYKYSLLATADHKYVVDVNVHFDAVTRLLHQMVDADADLDRIELFSPTGASLGRINSTGIPDGTAATAEILGADQEVWQPGRLVISQSVASDVTNCCECRVKGLVSERDHFNYRFVASISTQALQASLKGFQLKFIYVFAAVTLLALALAWWITAMLSKKIGKIRATVEKIAEDHNYEKEIPVQLKANGKPSDELDVLASGFNRMMKAVRESQEKTVEARKAEAQSVIAAQVAHDIRSPLTSMGIALSQLQQGVSSDAIATMKHGIDRVSGILKKLSNTYGKKTEAQTESVEMPRLVLLDSVFKNVIQEHEVKLANAAGSKKLVAQGFTSTPCIWSVVQVTEIQSALSNILNNAAEAVSAENGKVTASLNHQGSQLELSVSDNGVGIAPENLHRIFERKFTHGKVQGTGLGLFQAKIAIEWNGGKIAVRSTPSEGSCFTITLPTERQPDWVANQLKLSPSDKIVFVDDDPSVLALWKARISAELDSRVSYFKSLEELKKAVATRPWPADTILIIDQFLGPESSGTRGMDFLIQHELKNRGYLCTSEYDDPEIQAQIRKQGLRLIPKPCIGGFSITQEG